MKTRLPHFFLGLAALGACATSPRQEEPPASSVADRQRTETRKPAERVEIPVAAGDTMLSAAARASLHAFADTYLRHGHGALTLSTPSGGANADAAATLALQARGSLLEAGVSYVAVAGATYDAAGAANAPIVVSFARLEAHAAEGPRSEVLTPN